MRSITRSKSTPARSCNSISRSVSVMGGPSCWGISRMRVLTFLMTSVFKPLSRNDLSFSPLSRYGSKSAISPASSVLRIRSAAALRVHGKALSRAMARISSPLKFFSAKALMCNLMIWPADVVPAGLPDCPGCHRVSMSALRSGIFSIFSYRLSKAACPTLPIRIACHIRLHSLLTPKKGPPAYVTINGGLFYAPNFPRRVHP